MSELINRFRTDYIRTKKSLGQHFLTNRHFVDEIAAVSVLTKDEQTVEIGPGCGVLTEALAKLTKNLTVIDIDDNAIEFLNKNKDEFFPEINIVHSDFLKIDLNDLCDNKTVITGNLPYNISVKIVEHCTNYIDKITRMVFMFQKEVAQRISTPKDNKDYSSLTVYIDYHYTVKKIRDISGTNFWPNANVMSTVLVFEPKTERLLSREDETGFFEMIRKAFKQKRKTLYNNLKEYEKIAQALDINGFSPTIRAEQLSLDDFVKIYKTIK